MNAEELTRFLTKRGFQVDKVEQGFIVYLQGQVHEAEQLYAEVKESTPVHFEYSQKEIIASLRDRYLELYNKLEDSFAKLQDKEIILDERITMVNSELDKKIALTEGYLSQSLQASVVAAEEDLNSFADGISEQFQELFEMQVKEPNALKKLWRKIRGDKQSDNSSDSG